MDRRRPVHAWEVAHRRTEHRESTAWWPAKAAIGVLAGAIPQSQVPVAAPGWRLGWKWQAEITADAGAVDVALALDLAARWNAREAYPRVRAIPRPDGNVVLEPTRVAPSEPP